MKGSSRLLAMETETYVYLAEVLKVTKWSPTLKDETERSNRAQMMILAAGFMT